MSNLSDKEDQSKISTLASKASFPYLQNLKFLPELVTTSTNTTKTQAKSNPVELSSMTTTKETNMFLTITMSTINSKSVISPEKFASVTLTLMFQLLKKTQSPYVSTKPIFSPITWESHLIAPVTSHMPPVLPIT